MHRGVETVGLNLSWLWIQWELSGAWKLGGREVFLPWMKWMPSFWAILRSQPQCQRLAGLQRGASLFFFFFFSYSHWNWKNPQGTLDRVGFMPQCYSERPFWFSWILKPDLENVTVIQGGWGCVWAGLLFGSGTGGWSLALWVGLMQGYGQNWASEQGHTWNEWGWRDQNDATLWSL